MHRAHGICESVGHLDVSMQGFGALQGSCVVRREEVRAHRLSARKIGARRHASWFQLAPNVALRGLCTYKHVSTVIPQVLYSSVGPVGEPYGTCMRTVRTPITKMEGLVPACYMLRLTSATEQATWCHKQAVQSVAS